MPRLSLGTSHLITHRGKLPEIPSFTGFLPERLYRSLNLALEAGLRGIDTALIYRSHHQIRHVLGDWFGRGELERSDIFLSSKIFHATPGVATEGTYIPYADSMSPDEVRIMVRLHFEQTLMELGVGYVDLMLLHWPAVMNSKNPLNAARRLAAWQVLEEYYKRGWTRAIGVSNFSEVHLKQLETDGAEIRPMVNQIEASVYMQYDKIVAYCKQHGIVVQAFSPLGRGLINITNDRVVGEIAKKHKRDPGQIAMRYLIQLDYAVTFLSSSAERLKSNQQIFAFELDADDMQKLTALNRANGSWGLPSPYDMS
jgi:diketogulonate reductase-like aldo/keto reductase